MTLGLLRRAATTIALALTLTVAGALIVAAPGAATAGTTGPTITAPAAGQTVPFQSTGPLTVAMTGAAAGDYTGLLSCRSGDTNGYSRLMFRS